MNTLTRWLAIPLSRIPLVKYFLYPARIIIRKKPVSEHGGIETAWLPYRYGVMPDGSEVSLGCTVDTARPLAEEYYGAHLQRVGVAWWTPINTKGSDFHPIDATNTPLPHFRARTWKQRRGMWREYLECKHVPGGSIKTPFTGRGTGRKGEASS